MSMAQGRHCDLLFVGSIPLENAREVLSVLGATFSRYLKRYPDGETGERAGWVQKISKKGWVCKTWEGELSMVSMHGTTPEKFIFTVRDDSVADAINKLIGQRVSLHYEEKVGLPTTCFGETSHFVTKVNVMEQIPLMPGNPTPKPAVPLAN